MKLECLSVEDMEQVRQWRNQDLTPWRTPYYLTEKMQTDYYYDVVCNRNASLKLPFFETLKV